LDAKSAADLLGRSLPEAVNEGARQFTRRMAEAQKAMAEQQQQQQQAMMAAQQQANLEQQEMELSKMSVDTAMKQEAMERKSAQPIIQAAARHLEPNEQEALEPLNA